MGEAAEGLVRMTRSHDVQNFLRAASWDKAAGALLQADFSSRRFARLTQADGATAILMQAGGDQRTAEFVTVAGMLRDVGLSAPEIYAAEVGRGLVLMEDFGDVTFGKLLDGGWEKAPLYFRAAAVLARLHQKWDPRLRGDDGVRGALPVFTAALFTHQAELFLDHYVPVRLGRAVTDGEREDFRTAWLETLKPLEALPQTLLLRDFMPDNLMDLSARQGWRDVGLLDFQDAGLGPVAYDLASLCEAVRRDGGPEMLERVLAYYLECHPVMPLADLRRACHVLAVQRHMRVLGILAQKPEKRIYETRVRGYIDTLLSDDGLKAVRRWMKDMTC